MPTGPVVVLTREHEDNLLLMEELQQRGLRVVDYPCIETRLVPPEEWRIDTGREPDSFRVLVFTSRRGVRGFAPARHLVAGGERLIATVGKSTAEEVRRVFDRDPDVVGDPPTGAGLATSLVSLLRPGESVLYIRGDRSTGDLKKGLEDRGFPVSQLQVYENVAPEMKPLDLYGPIILVVASPSAVQRFFETNFSCCFHPGFVAIGPTTAGFLRRLGLRRVLTADTPSVDGLVSRVLEMAGKPEFRDGEFRGSDSPDCC